MEKNRIRVRICGIEYTLVSTEEPEYIHRVAYMVDKKMTEIMLANTKLSTAQAAVLTAVNLADERIRSTDDTDNLREQVAEYSRLSEEYKQKCLDAERKLSMLKKKVDAFEKSKKTVKGYSDGFFSDDFEDFDDLN